MSDKEVAEAAKAATAEASKAAAEPKADTPSKEDTEKDA